jgi:hypothetical protein
MIPEMNDAAVSKRSTLMKPGVTPIALLAAFII